MSLITNLLNYKMIWEENGVLKGMSPVSLNMATKKMIQFSEKGIKENKIKILKINKK